jgi:hypothetical protein
MKQLLLKYFGLNNYIEPLRDPKQPKLVCGPAADKQGQEVEHARVGRVEFSLVF